MLTRNASIQIHMDREPTWFVLYSHACRIVDLSPVIFIVQPIPWEMPQSAIDYAILIHVHINAICVLFR